jgi:RNA polymerase sigma factor (sigma-70 family)
MQIVLPAYITSGAYDQALVTARDVHLNEDIVQEIFLLQCREKEQCNLQEYGRFKAATTSVIQENIVDKEREQIIKEGVKRLPARQQLAYTLRGEHGWKRERIAKELDISPSTVKGHIQKAIKFLYIYVSKRMEY